MKKVKTRKLKVKDRISINQISYLVEVKQLALYKTPYHLIAFTFLLFTFYFLLSPPVFAQIDVEPQNDYNQVPVDVVPPPLYFISDEEKDQLNEEPKMKKRIQLSLELMDARLTNSEQLLEKNQYQQSLDQTGKFRGLLMNTLKYMKSNQGRRGSLKSFKKVEMKLRDFLPRLEIIRRALPFKYGYHLQELMSFVRDSRTKALNPLFDDTVLPEVSN